MLAAVVVVVVPVDPVDNCSDYKDMPMRVIHKSIGILVGILFIVLQRLAFPSLVHGEGLGVGHNSNKTHKDALSATVAIVEVGEEDYRDGLQRPPDSTLCLPPLSLLPPF